MNTDSPNNQRRATIKLVTSSALLASPLVNSVLAPLAHAQDSAAPAIRTDTITMLYRRESDTAPSRLDPSVQSALLALEDEFIQRGFRVIQPTADAYKIMDKGQSVIVTFADDAGFTLVFSAYQNARPVPGQEAAIAEIRLQARVFVGRNILVASEGRGQMFTRTEAGNKEFGERRAMEVAAKKAAADLAGKAAGKLKSLSQADIAAMVLANPSGQGSTAELAPPAPAPVQTAPVVTAPTAAPPTTIAVAPSAPATPQTSPSSETSATEELPPPRRRWALLVGVSDYAPVRAKLGDGVSDLKGVATDLVNLERGLNRAGFAAENVVVLKNDRATSGNLRQEFRRLVTKVGADDLAVIFISAHGTERDFNRIGFGMPILSDYDPRDPNALDFWELQSLVGNLPAQRIVWMIDTCHSGGATNLLPRAEVSSRGIVVKTSTITPDAKAVSDRGKDGKDFAVVTASRPTEVSWEDGSNGGLFTSTMIAAIDASKGASSLEKLFKERVEPKVISSSLEICKRNPSCPAPQQTPMFAYRGRGNLIRL